MIDTLKTLYTNLSKVQRIGLIIFIQFIVVILIATIIRFSFQEKDHIDTVYSDEVSSIQVPAKNWAVFENSLWDLIEDRVGDVSENIIKDVVIRDGTYQETELDGGKSANFIIDIDSIKQTYTVSIGWATDPKSGDEIYDNVIINCPPRSEMKYPETICQGMYNSTYSLDLYLPYEIESPFVDEYGFAAPDLYIDGDEATHIITVSLNPCNNAEEFRKKADDYIKTIPGHENYQVIYEIGDGIDVVCEEDLQNGD